MPRRPLAVAVIAAALCAPAAAQRWESLFDGETLTGWTTTGGRYDGDAAWSVEDGAIVGRVGDDGAGGLLYTEDVFASFEVELEASVDWPFDSGVFVRMWPEGKGAQVTLDTRPDGEVGAVYSDGFLQHNTWARDELWRRDGWNHVRVRCTGFDMRVQAWIDGVKVADHRVAPNAAGFAPRGRIGLQVHGGRDDPRGHRARFRNLRVRRLDLFDEDDFAPHPDGGEHRLVVSDEGVEAGWRALIDDELSAWRSGAPGGELVDPLSAGYRVEDGVLAIPSRGSGDLISRDDVRDVALRLEFALATMANGGVFLRSARDGGNPSFTGAEVQLLDDHDWEAVTGTTLAPWQFTGSLYGAAAPEVSVLRPTGAWNTLELLYRDTRLAVALNGHVLYDVDTLALEADPPFAERVASGFLGLQRYASPAVEGDVAIRVRNMFVRAAP